MTAPSALPSPETDATRRRILDAAAGVFAAHGYAAASTREIAAAAGIGKRMLFYYFATKEDVYRAVLERIVQGLVAIHGAFRNDPGPIGLTEAIEGLNHFTAANLDALKILMREIIDDGPYVAELTERYWKPLYAMAGDEVARNMRQGVFRAGEPIDVLINVGGLTLFYFLMLPMLTRIAERDPLAASTLRARAASAVQLMTAGLVANATPEGSK